MNSRHLFFQGGFKVKIFYIIALLGSITAYVLAVQPFSIPEAAYVFAVPFLAGAFILDLSKQKCYITAFIISTFSNLVLFYFSNTFSIINIFTLGFWLAVAALMMKKVIEDVFIVRISSFLGLAALWTALEYLQGQCSFLGPWLPLSMTQWERPTLLQMASWTGSYGVSFVLIFLNICLSAFVIKIIRQIYQRKPLGWNSGRCIEIYLALALMFVNILLFTGVVPSNNDSVMAFSKDQLNVRVLEKKQIESPKQVRKSTSSGADCLVINASEALNTEEIHAVFRAIENRRPIICQKGPDCFLLINELGYREVCDEESIKCHQKFKEVHTVYARYGDWFLLVCLGFMGFGFYIMRRYGV